MTNPVIIYSPFSGHVVLEHFKQNKLESALFGKPDGDSVRRFCATFSDGHLAITGDIFAATYSWRRDLSLCAFANISATRLAEKLSTRFIVGINKRSTLETHADALRHLSDALIRGKM